MDKKAAVHAMSLYLDHLSRQRPLGEKRAAVCRINALINNLEDCGDIFEAVTQTYPEKTASEQSLLAVQLVKGLSRKMEKSAAWYDPISWGLPSAEGQQAAKADTIKKFTPTRPEVKQESGDTIAQRLYGRMVLGDPDYAASMGAKANATNARNNADADAEYKRQLDTQTAGQNARAEEELNSRPPMTMNTKKLAVPPKAMAAYDTLKQDRAAQVKAHAQQLAGATGVAATRPITRRGGGSALVNPAAEQAIAKPSTTPAPATANLSVGDTPVPAGQNSVASFEDAANKMRTDLPVPAGQNSVPSLGFTSPSTAPKQDMPKPQISAKPVSMTGTPATGAPSMGQASGASYGGGRRLGPGPVRRVLGRVFGRRR